MVRQEESVTTPEATIILDQRWASFAGGPGAAFSGTSGEDGHELITSDTFEWAVTAAMSVSAHLAERNYSLRLLDPSGEPAFLHSPSAPQPESEEYPGSGGLQSIAESLAAVQLTGAHHAQAPESGLHAFDDRLMDKLSAHRQRGPVMAILGHLQDADARSLSAAAVFGANAFAIVVTEHPGDCRAALESLRSGGWRAVAVAPGTSLPAAWSYFDQPDAAAATAAADVRRATGVSR
jgi:uncharacterized protein (DUF58 family)